MQFKKFILALVGCSALVACGDTLGEQAVGGAAIGAGAAVITNNNVVEGAAVGAGANVLYCQLYPSQCN
ncbi:MAG: hypothetical protein AB8B47_06015 [Roseobacter sp.]